MMGLGGFDNPNSALYDYGLTNDTSHVFKLQAVWYAPLGIVLSTNYLGRSGGQYAAYFTYNLGRSAGRLFLPGGEALQPQAALPSLLRPQDRKGLQYPEL